MRKPKCPEDAVREAHTKAMWLSVQAKGLYAKAAVFEMIAEATKNMRLTENEVKMARELMKTYRRNSLIWKALALLIDKFYEIEKRDRLVRKADRI